MNKENFPITLPTWEEVEKNSTEEFISYRFKKVLEGNLYVCIERRKPILPTSGKMDRLVFSFCTRSDSAIAIEDFKTSEEGYRLGMLWLYNWSKELAETLASFKNIIKEKDLPKGITKEELESV